MDFEKRCQWCGKSFIAHKMTTLYCSKSCTGKAYKAKQKKKMKEESEREQQSSVPSLGCIGEKPYLTPYDVSILLEVSLATVYRYMAQGVIKAYKFKQRTRIRRIDLDAIFEDPTYKKRAYHKNKISEVYTMKEIMEKYQITKRTAMRRIERFDIPKIYEGRNVTYPKASIDKYFEELIEEIRYEDYYTPEQMMEKFNMSRGAVISFAQRHKIPRINRHHDVFYSKPHVDSLKGYGEAIDPLYYTYKEVMEKYGFSKDQVSYYLHTYNINRFKRGSFTMINRKDFDKVIKERMNGSVSIAELNSRIEDARELGTVMEQKESSSEDLEVIPCVDLLDEDDSKLYGKVEGYINAEEISERYKQSKKWVHYLTRKKKVPRVQKAGILFYDEKVVDEVFRKYSSTESITEWYTTDDIEEKYNMTPVARRSFTHRHNIPTKKEYGITYYSKLHVDFARNPGLQYAEDYYMVEQIMEKYHVDRETVYGIVRYKKIPSVKDGQFSLYLKSAIDKFFTSKKE